MGLVMHGARRGLLPGWFGGASRAVTERADAALSDVGLTGFAERPIGQLSGGQQQRVFLARALARDADLLLLDEPFAGVDAATEALLLQHFARLAREGRTVIAVHHDLDAVRAHFDDAIVVNRELVAAGPVSEVLAPDVLARAYGERALVATAGI
jgi:manganese/zinc/iron transport system ATP- binding protein